MKSDIRSLTIRANVVSYSLPVGQRRQEEAASVRNG